MIWHILILLNQDYKNSLPFHRLKLKMVQYIFHQIVNITNKFPYISPLFFEDDKAIKVKSSNSLNKKNPVVFLGIYIFAIRSSIIVTYG